MSSSTRNIAFLHLGRVHDEFQEIVAALSELGVRSHLIHLRDCDSVDWSRYSAVNVRESRNYHLHRDFLSRLKHIHASIAPLDLVNAMTVINGSLDKAAYLPYLEEAGVQLVPTFWPQHPTELSIETIFASTGWSEFVVKPRVSSKSWNTFRVKKHNGRVSLWAAEMQEPAHDLSLDEVTRTLRTELKQEPYFVQRFMPEIEKSGEISFVFLGGYFSHTIHKTAAANHWLAHEFYGGSNTPCAVNQQAIRWSENIHEILVSRMGRLHYARIDAIPHCSGFYLLECELIVPRLFLREAHATARYARILIEGF